MSNLIRKATYRDKLPKELPKEKLPIATSYLKNYLKKSYKEELCVAFHYNNLLQLCANNLSTHQQHFLIRYLQSEYVGILHHQYTFVDKHKVLLGYSISQMKP